MKRFSFSVISILAFISFVLCFGCYNKSILENQSEDEIKGFNLVAPRDKFPLDSLVAIQSIGANWVSIVPYAFTDPAIGSVVYGNGRQWWGETPEGITTTIQMAHSLGLKVMLKPHLWVRGQGWAGDLSFESEEMWQVWEHNYAAYLKTYTDIAEREGVELFCIGTEIRNATKLRMPFWKGEIAKIKRAYKGKLTYAANWDEFKDVPFWNELDYIGIDAYFPISSDKTPKVVQLVSAWEKPKVEMKALSDTYQKPILFTEYGYESSDYNAIGHWNVNKDSIEVNYEAQLNAYKALYQSFDSVDWWAGGFIWKWHLNLSSNSAGMAKTYTPQNKPALRVISRYFQTNQLK